MSTPVPTSRPRRFRTAAVVFGVLSAVSAAVYAQLHRDEFEAMARGSRMTAHPQT